MFIIDPNQPYSTSCASLVAKLRGRPTVPLALDIAEALETIQNAVDQINRILRQEIEPDDLDGAGGAAGGATEVQDEGTALTQRSALNFVGGGVTATDDAANDRTVVTIPGGGSGELQTPWLSNINGDGYDLTNAHDIGADFLTVANHILCPHIYCTSDSPGSGDEGFAPRIAFKWDGMTVVNTLVGMDATGVIRTWSNETAAAAYVPFAAARLMSKSGGVNFLGLPTSTAGLVSGDVWIDTAAGNVLKIVP